MLSTWHPGTKTLLVCASAIFLFCCRLSNAQVFPGPDPWIDITAPAYGAVGDGTTDNATAINAAFAAIPTGVNAGGRIFIPCGNFLIKSQIVIPVNTPIEIIGAGPCSIITKDFDAKGTIGLAGAVFDTLTQVLGTPTTLKTGSNANQGDQQLNVVSASGFNPGQWIVISDGTGVGSGFNCVANSPPMQSCNLELQQIDSVNTTSNTINLTMSLDSGYVASSAKISSITPVFVNAHDFAIQHGPDCTITHACIGRVFNLFFPVNFIFHHIAADIGAMAAVVQPHRGKFGDIHDNIFRNGDSSVTQTGGSGDPLLTDEATAYYRFHDNTAYKFGQIAFNLQSHHSSVTNNVLNGMGDDCANTHGMGNHDILISDNICNGLASTGIAHQVQGLCFAVEDGDFGVTITNNTCSNFGIRGIEASSTAGATHNVTIKGNHIYYPIQNSSGTFPPNSLDNTMSIPNVGIYVSYSSQVHIEGNEIFGSFPSSGTGILCESCVNSQITGNTVMQRGSATNDVGILITNYETTPPTYVQSSSVIVANNIVNGWHLFNCEWAVPGSTMDSIISQGNDCYGNPGADYSYDSHITNLLRVANLGDSATYPTVQNCGTTAGCAAKGLVGAQIASGIVTLSAGSATVTGINPAFSSTSSFGCTTADTTTKANASLALPASSSSITVTGTGTDKIIYQCIGN